MTTYFITHDSDGNESFATVSKEYALGFLRGLHDDQAATYRVFSADSLPGLVGDLSYPFALELARAADLGGMDADNCQLQNFFPAFARLHADDECDRIKHVHLNRRVAA